MTEKGFKFIDEKVSYGTEAEASFIPTQKQENPQGLSGSLSSSPSEITEERSEELGQVWASLNEEDERDAKLLGVLSEAEENTSDKSHEEQFLTLIGMGYTQEDAFSLLDSYRPGEDLTSEPLKLELEKRKELSEASALFQANAKLRAAALDANSLKTIVNNSSELDKISDEQLEDFPKIAEKAAESIKLKEEILSNPELAEAVKNLSDEELSFVIEQTSLHNFEDPVNPVQARILSNSLKALEAQERRDFWLRKIVDAAESPVQLSKLNRGQQDFLIEFGQVLIPFVETTRANQLLQHLFGDYGIAGSEGGLAEDSFGSMKEKVGNFSYRLEKVVEALRELSPEEQAVAANDIYNKLMEIKSSGKFAAENELIIDLAVSTLESAFTEDSGSPLLHPFFLSLQAIGDYTGVGTIAVAALRRGVSSVMRKVRLKDKYLSSNEDAAALVHHLSSEELDATAKSFGHNWVVGNIVNTPQGEVKITSDMVVAWNYMQKAKTAGVEPGQIEHIVASVRSGMTTGSKALEEKGISFIESASTFEVTRTGMQHRAVYHISAKNEEQAEMLATKKFGNQPYELKKSEEHGLWEVVKENHVNFSKEVKNLSEMGFKSNMLTAAVMPGNRWLLNPESLFQNDFIAVNSLAERLSAEMRDKISHMIDEPRQALLSSKRDNLLLNDLLNKYNGKEIPASAWEELPPNIKQYYDNHLRPALDMIWTMENQNLRDALHAKGSKGIVYKVGEDEYEATGKALSQEEVLRRARKGEDAESDARFITAYDSVAGKEVKVDVAKAYEKGHKIVDVDDYDLNGLSSRFVLVKSSGEGAYATELPLYVAKYLPNYSPRYYDKRFYVGKMEDGKERVLYATDSWKEAQELEAKVGKGAFTREDRSDIDRGQLMNRSIAYETSRRMRSRASEEGLEDIAGESAAVENSLNSIYKYISSYSNQNILGERIDNLKSQFMKDFGPQLKHPELGYPTTVNQISDPTAATAWKYIERLEGTHLAMSVEGQRKVAKYIGRGLERVLKIPQAEAKVYNAFSGDYSKGAKGLGFYVLLAMNPFRQVVMQGQHSLINLARTPGQFKSLGQDMVLSQLVLHSSGASISKESLEFAQKMATVLKFDKDRFNQYHQLFDELGLAQHIRAHAYTGQSFAQEGTKPVKSVAEDAIDKAKHLVMFVPELGRKVGFDVGEGINLSGAFAAAVRKYQDDMVKLAKEEGRTITIKDVNIMSSEAAVKINAEIGTNLWHMSGNAGAAPYKDGLLGVLTQFWSVQHKGLLSVLPVKIGKLRTGGRGDLTGAEKARVASFLLLNYGTDGIGLTKFADRIATSLLEDPELEEYFDNRMLKAIKVGLLGEFFNRVAGRDVSFSRNFSVGSNSFLGAVLLDTTLGSLIDKSFQGNIKGLMEGTPAFSAGEKVARAAMNISDIWKFEGEGGSLEKILHTFDEAMKVSPMMSNLAKYELMKEQGIALSKHGAIIDRDFQPYSGWAALMGLPSEDTTTVWEAKKKLDHEVSRMTPFDKEKAIREDARKFFNNVQRFLLENEGVFRDTKKFREAMLANLDKHILKAFPEGSYYREQYKSAFHELLMEDHEDLFATAVDKAFHSATHIGPEEVQRVIDITRDTAYKTGREDLKTRVDDMRSFQSRTDLVGESLDFSIFD